MMRRTPLDTKVGQNAGALPPAQADRAEGGTIDIDHTTAPRAAAVASIFPRGNKQLPDVRTFVPVFKQIFLEGLDGTDPGHEISRASPPTCLQAMRWSVTPLCTELFENLCLWRE